MVKFGKLGNALVPEKSFVKNIPKYGYYNTMLPKDMVKMYNAQQKSDSKAMFKGKPRSKY